MFSRISWLDKRTTSGTWRVAKDFAGLPAWIVKAVGGSTVHWAGASLRFQEHEFKAKTVYGDVPNTTLLDWPITLAEMEPWYDKAEDKMGTTRTHGIPGLPGSNNYKVFEAGAKKLGYKEVSTGRMSINSEARGGRGACQQIGFCFQGCKSGAKWSTLVAEIPAGELTGNLEVRPNSQVVKIEHDDGGKVTGVVYADKDGKLQNQKARVVCVAGNSFESPRLSAQLGVEQVPRWPRQFLGPGRAGTTCATRPAPSMPSSKSPCTCIAAPPWPASSRMKPATILRAALSAAMSSKPCRSGCRSWRPSSIPANGAVRSPKPWRPMTAWPACGSSARTCRRTAMPSRYMRRKRTSIGMPVPNVHFDDHANDVAMREHAFKQGSAIYDAVGAVKTFHTPPYPSTHNLGTNRMSENPRDGVVNKWGQTHDVKNLFISDGSQFTTGAAENPTLTIVALAIRQADHIAAEMSKGNL